LFLRQTCLAQALPQVFGLLGVLVGQPLAVVRYRRRGFQRKEAAERVGSLVETPELGVSGGQGPEDRPPLRVSAAGFLGERESVTVASHEQVRVRGANLEAVNQGIRWAQS
jgi:hypothetical protein